MAEIESGNVELYIRQLLSEELDSEETIEKPTSENILDDENFKLIEKMLNENKEING